MEGDDPLARSRRRAAVACVAISAASIAIVSTIGPVAQSVEYHAFADRRAWVGIRNAADVLSNLAFVVAGVLGVLARRRDRGAVPAGERTALLVYALALVAVAFGSGAYHLDPTHRSLVWDRLPMAVAFGAFFALVLGERLGERVGRAALFPLVTIGIASVLHWSTSLDARPGGDLRAYGVVKFLPVLLTVVLLLAVPQPRETRGPIVVSLLLFGAATAFEELDVPVFLATGGHVSGHTVKHVVAAAAAACLVAWYARRQAIRAGARSP